MQRLLRVEAPHFTAGAVWSRRHDGTWACVEAAPIIGWMVGKGPVEVKSYLIRKGWSFQWLQTGLELQKM